MKAELLDCGYSYHMETFYIQRKSALPSFLFRLQTEGRCEACVGGKLTPIEAGDLLLYKPGDTYELRVEEQDSSQGTIIASGDYYLFCQGPWVEAWWERAVKPAISRIALDEKLLSLWRQLVLEKRRVEEADEELSGYLLRALCIYLERASTETTLLPRSTFVGTRMKRYIEEHATATFKIEDVANHVGLSVSRAARLFKDCFGKTMVQHALDVRLSIAVERMKYSSMSLEQIALSCGFGSYAYFHRVFTGAYRVSPKAYRLQE